MMEEAKLPSPPLFAEEKPAELTEEEERQKRAIYEKMNPRRRKFIDKIGYEVWNPFQAPKDPLDIRKDRTGRDIRDLLRQFMSAAKGDDKGDDWKRGARECALGIIKKDEKFQGIFDFCLWYSRVLEKEDQANESQVRRP